MKMLVLGYIDNEVDGPDIRVPLDQVSDIGFDPDADYDVTVWLDNGKSYDCDNLTIEK